MSTIVFRPLVLTGETHLVVILEDKDNSLYFQSQLSTCMINFLSQPFIDKYIMNLSL